MKVKRLLSLMLTGIMVMSMVAGCGSAPESSSDSASPDNVENEAQDTAGEAQGSEETEEENYRDTINIGLSNDFHSFDLTTHMDTITFNAAIQVEETLMNMTEDWELTPCLAESWEQIDELNYRIHLRKGVKFHNGEELKASDAVFSLKRCAETSLLVGAAGNIDPEAFVIEDDYTFTFTTFEPYADTLIYLAFPSLAIISEKEFNEKGGEYGTDASGIGTGPYKFEEWKTGEYVKLVRNEEYWGGAPKTETLCFRILTEPSTRVIALETGDVDFIYFVPCSSLDSLEANEDIVVKQYPGTTGTFFMPKVSGEPFTDLKVRQALAYAIDNKSLCKVVFGEGAAAIECMVPKGFASYEEGLAYPYDPEKAKELLKEAGYDENNPLTFEVWIHDQSEYRSALEIMQGMWSEVNVNIDIKVLEAASMSAATAVNEQPTTLGPSGSVSGLPYDIYYGFKTECIPPAGAGNRVEYSNADYDALVSQAKVETDPEKREEIFKECQKMLLDEAIVIPVFNKNIIFAYNKNLENVEMLPANRAYFGQAVLK